MPISSNDYSFQSVSAHVLIKEAFERLGMIPDTLTSQQFEGALRSINLLLTDWSNRNLNFWTLEQDFIGLIPGVKSYSLPIQTLKVIQCELRTSVRNNVGGVATAADGANPEYAFDDDPAHIWTAAAINSNIQYVYPLNNTNIITFVGINANNPNKTPWNIKIQGSLDGVNNWVTLKTLPANQVYPDNQIKWFELDNIVPFAGYRITQYALNGNNDASNLSIRKLYFNNNVLDITMSEINQYNYLQYPQKNLLGRPVVYYVNYQVNPMIYIWQNPSSNYNCMFYSAQQMIQTVLNASDAIDIPSAFYDPLVWGLCYRLAQKYAVERLPNIEGVYRDSLDAAIIKNRVNPPVKFGLYGTGS